MARNAHLVGSVGLENAETVFTTVADILGERCPRIPDGETGQRGYWIRWQQQSFDASDDFQVELTHVKIPGFKDAVERSFFRIKDGVDAAALDMGALGYGAEAVASYQIFAALQADGKIPQGARFQVSVPSPMALLSGFVIFEDRLRAEPAIEAALARDIGIMQADIPADRLSLQWDVCYEIVGADGGPPLPYDDAIDGSVQRIARLCGLVNEAAELGIHLCYGDPGHSHILEPADLGTSVAFANGITAASPQRVDFMHMPVPRGRSDDAYFAALAGLTMPAETKLILGLVHHTDGAEGGRARMAAADKYVTDYDIATECGFGRRDAETIPALLRIHREMCA
jgi:hypothetical protein